ncbi:MAG: sugar phosphate isomerase/epimerase, partial [Epulopiscium sp.]|nr:sugar phosphate isomerase/epimerase [Candidatus Epulonipiscium sp.]
MKLSVSMWSLWPKISKQEADLKDFLRFCWEQKVQYVELLDIFIPDQETLQEAKTLLNKYSLTVSSFSIGNDFVQEKEEDRKKEVETIKEKLKVATQLGAAHMRVFSGNMQEGITFETAKQWIIDGFKEVVPYAQEQGITLVLENHGLLAGKSTQVKEIINAVGSPYFRANPDTGNFLLADEDPLQAVTSLKDLISFVHFKDLKEVPEGQGEYTALSGKKYEGTILGEGQVPMEN